MLAPLHQLRGPAAATAIRQPPYICVLILLCVCALCHTETLASPPATSVACDRGLACEEALAWEEPAEPLVLSLVFAKADQPAHAHRSTHAHYSTLLAGSAGSGANSECGVKALVSAVPESVGARAAVLAAQPFSACASSSPSRAGRR